MNSQRWKGTRRIELERPNQHPVVNHHIDDVEIGTTVHGEPVNVDQTGTPRLVGELHPNALLSQPALSEADFIRQAQMDADMADQQPRTRMSDPWDDSIYVENHPPMPNPYPPVKAIPSPDALYVGTNADVGGSGYGNGGGGNRNNPPNSPYNPPDIEGAPAFAGKRGILDQLKQIPILKNAIEGYEFQGKKRDGIDIRGAERFNTDGKYSNSYISDLLTRTHLPDTLVKNPATGNLEPVSAYSDLNLAERAAIPVGRAARDLVGFGTQSFAWNINPLDVLGTFGHEVLGKTRIADANTQLGIPGVADNKPVATYKIPEALKQPLIYAAGTALGLGSGNFNPLNFAEGGRQQGFQAVTPNSDDPRQSDNALVDYTIQRGFFGRTGRLLPWEQFTQERPDVNYETYAKYQDYLKDQGVLGLGVAKGTMDGVDGPEARIAGYRVTPLGALAAAGTLGGALLAAKTMRRRS